MIFNCKYVHGSFQEPIEHDEEIEAVSIFAKNFALAYRLQEATLEVDVKSEKGSSRYRVTLTTDTKTNCKKL